MKVNADELAKQMLDTLSVITVIGSLLNLLPAIAALFTIIWTSVRIWETDTIRSITGRKPIGARNEGA